MASLYLSHEFILLSVNSCSELWINDFYNLSKHSQCASNIAIADFL
jgi:hypothetical protein